jgi:hypothetical protein
LKGSGRKKLLLDEDRSFLYQKVEESPKISAEKLSTMLAKEMGVVASKQTIRNNLHSLGLHGCLARKVPLLTSSQVSARFRFAQEWILWTLKKWDRVLFTDEVKFNLISSDGRVSVWRRDGEALLEKNVVSTVNMEEAV